MTNKEKWMKTMVEKHGSEEAVREFMRASANKSARNKGGTGGFNYLKRTNPELFMELSIKGGRLGRPKREV